MKTSRLLSVPLVALLLILMAIPASAVRAPSCAGKTATIWGKSGRINGTARADVIVGSSQRDVIDAKGGDDRVCARGADDTLKGGDGDDQLIGAGQETTLLGGDDNDVLQGGTSGDRLDGENGNDLLLGAGGNDAIEGGPHDGDGDFAWFKGPSGVQVSLDGGTAFGSRTGSDVLDGIENVIGSSGDDFLLGDNLPNILLGGKGNDVLRALGEDDTLEGELGNDALDGGLGNDNLDGGPNDPVNGDLENPTGDWADYQQVTNGTDPPSYPDINASLADGLATGYGTDTLAGIENLIGGYGVNHFIGDEGDNIIIGCDQSDTLIGNGGDDFLFGLQKHDQLYGDEEPEVPIVGTPGDDSLFGDVGEDHLEGGLGNDKLDGGAEEFGDSISYLRYATTTGVTVDLRDLDPQETGQGQDDIVDIEDITGTEFADTLIGDDQNNDITAFGGDDNLFGYGGDDFIRGMAGNDSADCGDHITGDSSLLVESPLNCEST